MNLFIIRHGQSEADLLHVHEGRADFSLTDEGRRQAERMAHWMRQRHPLDAIIASTLKRAEETAGFLAREYGLDVQPDPLLMEFQNGLVAGLSREEADARYPEPDIKYPHTALYEQESWIEFRMRAETALSKLIYEQRPDASIAVVTHGGMIGMLYRAFLELPVSNRTAFHSGDTAIHHWKVQGHTRHIVFANSLVHLGD